MQAIARLKEAFREYRASGRSLRASVRFCVDGAWRSAFLLRVFRPEDIHQSTFLTWMDRYPRIFSVCRDHFAGRPDLRILSYGCATGEEALTIRNYFPSARIVGAEINAHCLSVARKRKTDDGIAFVESQPARIQELGAYDAIFCLAVLQRTPMLVERTGVTNLKAIYPFEQFETKVTELDSWLNRSGLLIIYHSQYLFTDTSVSSKYLPLPSARSIRNKGPQFDRDGVRLDVPNNTLTNYSVFIKQQD